MSKKYWKKQQGKASPTPAPVPVGTETLLQKIDQAIAEAGQIVGTFVPPAGVAIEAGAALEPVIVGLIGMFGSLVKNKVVKKL